MIEKKDLISVGKFLKPHALKGELNAIFDIEALEITPDMPMIVEMDGIFVPFYAEGIRRKGQLAYLVKLDGQDSEEDARTFVNKTIYLRKSDFAEITDEEIEEGEYADDLVGFNIVDYASGNRIGTIADVDLSTQNALFIVETDQGSVYIPVSEDFITSIDEDENTITMNLPDGLIELNQKN